MFLLVPCLLSNVRIMESKKRFALFATGFFILLALMVDPTFQLPTQTGATTNVYYTTDIPTKSDTTTISDSTTEIITNDDKTTQSDQTTEITKSDTTSTDSTTEITTDDDKTTKTDQTTEITTESDTTTSTDHTTEITTKNDKTTSPDSTTEITTNDDKTTQTDQTTEITTKSDTTTSTDHTTKVTTEKATTSADHTTEITTTRNDKTTSADHTTKVTTEKATTSAEQTRTSLSTTRLAGSTSPQMSPTTKPNDKGKKLYLILLMVFAGGGFLGSVSIIVGLLIYYFYCRKFANDAVNGEDQPLLTVFDEQQGPLSPRQLEKFAKDASLPHCNKIMNNKLYQNVTTIQGRGKITIDTIFEENERHLFCTVDMLRKWDKQQECSIAEKQRKLKRAVKDAKSTARTAYKNLDAEKIKALSLLKTEDTAYDLLMMDIKPFAKELGVDMSVLNTYDRRHQAIDDGHTGTAHLLAMINIEEKFIVLREILSGSNDSSKCSIM